MRKNDKTKRKIIFNVYSLSFPTSFNLRSSSGEKGFDKKCFLKVLKSFMDDFLKIEL